jgi:hypothetical protein
MKIKVKLICFDSYGVKSSCTSVETPDVSILIDPGAAIMHPTFPAEYEDKVKWLLTGKKAIIRAAENTDIIVISHYHWDHFLPDNLDIYSGKKILVKNPNNYINESQRNRAIEFFENLWKRYINKQLDLRNAEDREYADTAEELGSINKDFGDYNNRRKELLNKGKKWFIRLRDKWLRWGHIPEIKTRDIEIIYPEGKIFRFGSTKLRFTKPMFHGIEYSRVGWVFSTIIEYGDTKILHSSDLNGPIIEDYADFIIRESPEIIILDGPMTYMLGYTLNLINFNRILKNAVKIVENVDFQFMIWDHHLPRERRYRKRTQIVWETAEKLGKTLLTAREFEYGQKPIVEEL